MSHQKSNIRLDLKRLSLFEAGKSMLQSQNSFLVNHKAGKTAEQIAAEAAEDASKVDKKKKKKKGVVVAVELADDVRKAYEETLAQIDNYNGEELAAIMKKFDIRSPESGNELSEPKEFNLMFESSIGPTGHLKGYLRPETAQGQFLNFKKLLEFNNDKMPFASAQVGRSFRNEISPRSGLLRVREFTMAEIEHYVDPENKQHPKFADVKDVVLTLLPKDVQLGGKTETVDMTIGEAVEKKIVDNETLGYFMARIYLFLEKIGIKRDRLRFRQHMDNEMAHYACDCWDAEIKTSYGWIECVGCADRSAYDLTVHSKRTGEKLVVREQLPEPRTVELWQVEINKKTFGPKFKKDAKAVEETLNSLSEDKYAQLAKELETAGVGSIEVNGQTFEVTKDHITVKRGTVTEHVREYTPNVIEPSFGIGRILYSLLEHSWWVREDDEAPLIDKSSKESKTRSNAIGFDYGTTKVVEDDTKQQETLLIYEPDLLEHVDDLTEKDKEKLNAMSSKYGVKSYARLLRVAKKDRDAELKVLKKKQDERKPKDPSAKKGRRKRKRRRRRYEDDDDRDRYRRRYSPSYEPYGNDDDEETSTSSGSMDSDEENTSSDASDFIIEFGSNAPEEKNESTLVEKPQGSVQTTQKSEQEKKLTPMEKLKLKMKAGLEKQSKEFRVYIKVI
ncbi:Putative Glycyl-tRNA synthetase [Rhizopus microsporus]|nr:Putative Glycyl-tRNA synthetase [Rhizopus microsporus]